MVRSSEPFPQAGTSVAEALERASLGWDDPGLLPEAAAQSSRDSRQSSAAQPPRTVQIAAGRGRGANRERVSQGVMPVLELPSHVASVIPSRGARLSMAEAERMDDSEMGELLSNVPYPSVVLSVLSMADRTARLD